MATCRYCRLGSDGQTYHRLRDESEQTTVQGFDLRRTGLGKGTGRPRVFQLSRVTLLRIGLSDVIFTTFLYLKVEQVLFQRGANISS
jgi:hypothetical protein